MFHDGCNNFCLLLALSLNADWIKLISSCLCFPFCFITSSSKQSYFQFSQVVMKFNIALQFLVTSEALRAMHIRAGAVVVIVHRKTTVM